MADRQITEIRSATLPRNDRSPVAPASVGVPDEARTSQPTRHRPVRAAEDEPRRTGGLVDDARGRMGEDETSTPARNPGAAAGGVQRGRAQSERLAGNLGMVGRARFPQPR